MWSAYLVLEQDGELLRPILVTALPQRGLAVFVRPIYVGAVVEEELDEVWVLDAAAAEG